MDYSTLSKIAKLLRYWILTITHQAGSGHPTSSFSAVELATVLFFKHLHADLDVPNNPANDRVIFSKGHASALLYSLYAVAGKISEEELMKYRTFDSTLEGHPTARFPFTEAATGSLGQGLSIGAGEAFALSKTYQVSSIKYQENSDVTRDTLTHDTARTPTVFVLLGDGELAEGSVWEAAAWSSHRKLHSLIAIADINRFGQAEPTMYEHNMDVYRRRFEAFGWATIVIDGHNLKEIDAAYQKAIDYKDGPSIILAKTIKGKGIAYWEDKPGWHNKMLPKEELEKAIAQYGNVDKTIRGIICKP